MVLPATSGNRKPRAVRTQGKFHGLMTVTTPIGRRTAIDTLPYSDGITSPVAFHTDAAAAWKTSVT